jgi:gas vesicle protein GvpL/GvpF
VIHVYGVVDDLSSLPTQPGIGGAPLEQARVGTLDLVVSRASSEEATHEAVLAHAQVVDELMARSRAVLPVRFTAFADEHELAEAVATKAATLEQALRRVRGCAEFGLRAVAAPAGAKPETSSGAEYMRARLAEEQRLERLVSLVHEPLVSLSRATTRTRSSTGVFEAAYLVPVENASAFRTAVERLQADHADLTVVCTGPWPPYSFGGNVEEAEL